MVVRIGLTTGRKRCYWVCKERSLKTCLFKGIIYGFPLKWKTVRLVLAPVCQNFEKYSFSCGYVFEMGFPNGSEVKNRPAMQETPV